MSAKFSKWWIVIAVLVLGAAFFGYRWYQARQSALPPGIVSGNGRIEAKLIDVSAKLPLRVKEVLVDEGALVKRGQVLVRMDTVTLEADLAKDKAGVGAAREELAAAHAGVVAAEAAVTQNQSEIRLAKTEAERQARMLAVNASSQALNDIRQTALETSRAKLQTAQAQVNAARAKADAARQQIDVALAEVAKSESRIQDATLVAPVDGRVLYRLAEPGEVLAAGGKALTLVNLSDVYMEIFLPSNQAAALKIGAPARITVDYEPDAAAAAYVSFVSPEAQFTPKQVETKSEREKLMFRVKIQIPPELVSHYVERIKTGVRGVGYVKLDADARWPDFLERGLLNAPAAQGK